MDRPDRTHTIALQYLIMVNVCVPQFCCHSRYLANMSANLDICRLYSRTTTIEQEQSRVWSLAVSMIIIANDLEM